MARRARVGVCLLLSLAMLVSAGCWWGGYCYDGVYEPLQDPYYDGLHRPYFDPGYNPCPDRLYDGRSGGPGDIYRSWGDSG